MDLLLLDYRQCLLLIASHSIRFVSPWMKGMSLIKVNLLRSLTRITPFGHCITLFVKFSPPWQSLEPS